MELTQEQQEKINDLRMACERIIEFIKNVYDTIIPIIVDIWKKVKKTLEKEITIAKHVRKGKRHIWKYNKTILWKELMRNRK